GAAPRRLRGYHRAMLGTNPIIAFVATRAPDRAKAFYRDVLGLRLVADEDFALVFDAGGTMLRVAKVAEHTPAPFTVLGWRVTAIPPPVEQLGRPAGQPRAPPPTQ